ncbi:hemolysin family protein [Chloroflexota bacterium]
MVVCVLFSGFFSSAETAFIGVQRFRLSHLMNNDVSGAHYVARIIERPERFLAAVLLGNNFVNVVAATVGTLLAVDLLGAQWGALAASLGVTILILVFGEVVPKTVAANHAERMAVLYAKPVMVLSWILAPFVPVLAWIGTTFTKIVGEPAVPRTLVSEEEIRAAVDVGEEQGVVEEAEAEMIHKVFEFGDRPVKEAMTPRTEITFVEKGAKLKDFIAQYSQTPYSRFPVYHNSRDYVVGILSIKDVLIAQAGGKNDDDALVDELIRPAMFVPETKRMGELLTEMQEQKQQMAVVIDEFGGTAGVVTLEQMIEEIVGTISDGLTIEDEEYEAVDENTFLVDGGLRISEANEELNLGLPDGDYETVAGFALHLLGHIPEEGEQLAYKNLKMVISKMRGMKIERVLFTKGEIPPTIEQ